MSTAVNPNRVGASRSPSGWLLASLSFHSTVMIILMLIANPHPQGRGRFGRTQEGGLTVTWIPGSGNGGQGTLDTVVSGDESETASDLPEAGSNSTDASTTLITIVATDPQAIFNSVDDDSLATNINREEKPASERETLATHREESSDNEGPGNSARVSSKTAVSTVANPKSTKDQANATNEGNYRSKNGREGGSGGGGATGAGGGPIQFFGLLAQAKSVVYVIDASESMRKHRAMEVAREELILSLNELSPTTRFQVIFFDLRTHSMNRPGGRDKLLLASPVNVRLAEQFIKGIQPETGTDRSLALTEALSLKPDTIFLLTDADEPEMSAKELWDIKSGNKWKSTIHVVEFGVGSDLSQDSFLKKLSRDNRGKHYYRDLTQPRDGLTGH